METGFIQESIASDNLILKEVCEQKIREVDGNNSVLPGQK